jgi:CheY-like chemotaxis protein
VDDDHVNQTVMHSLLGSAGYDLLTASTGQVRHRGAASRVLRPRGLGVGFGPASACAAKAEQAPVPARLPPSLTLTTPTPYPNKTLKTKQEALSLLAGSALFPDLLLLDNMMPDMSGCAEFKALLAIIIKALHLGGCLAACFWGLPATFSVWFGFGLMPCRWGWFRRLVWWAQPARSVCHTCGRHRE